MTLYSPLPQVVSCPKAEAEALLTLPYIPADDPPVPCGFHCFLVLYNMAEEPDREGGEEEVEFDEVLRVCWLKKNRFIKARKEIYIRVFP